MTKAELIELLDRYGYDEDDEVDLNELERIRAEERAELVERIEERQHDSGFYAFQDTMEMYRRER
ncbi:MAG: hypothetical protein J5956_10140 [Ruminococcus sp.]|nr:hypothetical protein [Ruminococcus sp.]